MSRFKIRAISFLVALFVVLGGLSIQSFLEADKYHRRLNAGYSHAFSELSTAIEEMNTALQKARYATSPALFSSLCTQIYGKSMSARLALSEIPYASVELEQTASFVATAGDYALAMSRSAVSNSSLSEVEREGLESLASASSSLSGSMKNLQADLDNGSLDAEDSEAVAARLSDGEITGGRFETMEEDFPEVPTLIYDGPFSEHLIDRKPIALEGMEEVTREEAQAAGESFLSLSEGALTLSSDGEGKIPAYSFSGGGYYIQVTKQGGQVLSVLRDSLPEGSGCSFDEGVAAARAFLDSRGLPGMAESYYINQNGVLTVNFAAKEGDVICYPDLVKVSVSLSDCSLAGFEAAGYYTNHRSRGLAQHAISAEESRKQVPSDLEVISHQLALIPTAGEYEVLCHEFKCQESDGSHIIIYVNAETGQQEKILILLEDENGTLAQ